MDTGNIWIVGGDRRQEALARLLAEEGRLVQTFALPAVPGARPADDLSGLGGADCVILPLPVTRDGAAINAPAFPTPILLENLFALLGREQVVLAGQVTPSLRAMAGERGIILRDYFAREELAVANTVPTAEGALQLAMEHLPITIHGARVLVVGFGRVGHITAQRFAALGARVTAAARRTEQLAWAQALGMTTLPLEQLSSGPLDFDLVVNTAPAPVLTRPVLEQLPRPCLILDLASQPGGVEAESADQLGLTVIHALSLPGKVAPVTAGAAIKDAICNMLRELGR